MPIHVRVYLYTCHIHAFIHVIQTLKLEHVQKKEFPMDITKFPSCVVNSYRIVSSDSGFSALEALVQCSST